MAATIFDHIKAITVTKDLTYWDNLSEQDRKSWSNYMVFRFLSMDSDVISLLATVQPVVQDVKPKSLYLLLCGLLPKSTKYNKYVKAVSAGGYQDWVIECVANHFSVSKSTAIDYIDVLRISSDGQDEIKRILTLYGYDDKEIKKLKL